MKVQVCGKTFVKNTAPLTIEVGATDTAADVKSRIALIEECPFPDQVLACGGKTFADDEVLAECGVSHGSSLTFDVNASEDIFAEQLANIISGSVGGALTSEELGYMYTLRHGSSVKSVLTGFGYNDSSLLEFIEQFGKRFAVDQGSIKCKAAICQMISVGRPLEQIPENSALETLFVTVYVQLSLPYGTQHWPSVDLGIKTSETAGDLSKRVVEATQIPFPTTCLIFRGSAVTENCSLGTLGLKDGDCFVFKVTVADNCLCRQFCALLSSRGGTLSHIDLDDLYCCRFGVSASKAVQLLGWGEKLPAFLRRQPFFSVTKGSVTLVEDFGNEPEPQNQVCRYAKLHEDLADQSFSACLNAELTRLADLISKNCFLDVDRVAKVGAIAKGLSIPGDVGAEIVLFIKGLKCVDWDRCVPGMSAALAAVINETLAKRGTVVNARSADGCVIVETANVLGSVTVRLSPAFETYAQALAAIRCQKVAAAQVLSQSTFAEQSVTFVQKQPDAVKATMRLARWWRLQRQWSSPESRPSDALLELVVAHSVLELVPDDLGVAVEDMLAMLSQFDNLSVTWPLTSRYYRESDVCQNLMGQKPLVLDPTNPMVNVAACGNFDPAEMIEKARDAFFA